MKIDKILVAVIGVLVLAADSGSGQAAAFKPPSASEAMALVNKALAVRKPDEVTAVIRPGTMTPAEVVNALQAISKVNGEPISTSWLSSIDKNGMSLEGVEVAYAGDGKKVKRLAFLTPDAKGVWKLDFPAFARLVQPAWKKLPADTETTLEVERVPSDPAQAWEKLLAGGKGTTGVVRVSVARDRYYNGPFQDEAVWAAYGMISPDMDALLLGYCMRNSDLYRAMELMWADDETQVVRATLEIRRVEGGDRRQFKITRVLAEDWVMGDKPFDETVAASQVP